MTSTKDSMSDLMPATVIHARSRFPFHVYMEGEKPYNGVVKDHPHFRKLVLIGISMTMFAGYINSIAIFDLFGYALTHLSGLTSSVAIQTIKGNYHKAGTFLGNIFSYGFGAGFAGFLVGHNKHTLGRHYALGFFLQGCVLFTITLLLDMGFDHYPIQFMICLACGIQNGMTSTYSNNILRTTHITGMINDTFVLIGYWLRTRNITADIWRLTVFFPIWLAFLIGSAIGTEMYMHVGYWAFLFPALFAWFWCLLLLLFRGVEEPLQWHMEPTFIPTPVPIEVGDTPHPKTDTETPAPVISSDGHEMVPLEDMSPSNDDNNDLMNYDKQKEAPTPEMAAKFYQDQRKELLKKQQEQESKFENEDFV